MNPQIWWHLARATGVVAWAGAVSAVLVGLLLASRAGGRAVPPAWLLALHRHLGALTLAFVAGHVGALIADGYVQFSLADALVPFHSGWRSGAVSWGVFGFWLLVVIEVSSLARRRLARRTWQMIHLASYGAAVATTVHFLTAGSDQQNMAVRWSIVAVAAAVAGLLTFRLALPRRRAARTVGVA